MKANKRHDMPGVSLFLFYILSCTGEDGKITYVCTYLKLRVCKLFSKVFITSILFFSISCKIVFSMTGRKTCAL